MGFEVSSGRINASDVSTTWRNGRFSMRVSEIVPYKLRSLVGEEKYEGYTDDAEA